MSNRYGLLDQSYNTGTTAQDFHRASANTALGQTFTAGVSKNLTWASVYFNTRVGAPTGNCYLELWNSNFTSLLATSDVIASTSITVGGLVAFVFSTPYAMTATTVYGLAVRGSWTIDNTNYFTLYRNTSSGYAGGSMFLYNGSTWADQSLDMRFNVFSNADGGFFDLDTSVSTSVLRTTIKGAAIAATDEICYYNGATITQDEALTCLRRNMGCSVGAVGTTVGDATAGQKYGIWDNTAGYDTTFGGSATVANSGDKSPATPGAETVNAIMKNGTPTVAGGTITNVGDAVDTNKRWAFNWTAGRYLIYSTTLKNSFQQPFTACPMDSTKTASGPIINNCTVSGLSGAITSMITAPNTSIDIEGDFRGNDIIGTGITGSSSFNIVVNSGGSTKLTTGGAIDVRGCKVVAATTGAIYPHALLANSTNAYYFNCKTSFSDIRPTKIVPTGLAFTDPGNGEELWFTISNIASYANADVIKIFNASGDAEIGATSKTRYVARAFGSGAFAGGYGIVPGLTADTLYTMYAKATSDLATMSNATATATGTPTLQATNPAYAALEATRNTLTANGEADVSLNKTWQYRGTTKTGSLVVASATAPTIEDIKNITSTSAIIVTGFASNSSTYKVYKNGVLVASGLSAVEYALTGLSPNTTYSITLVGTGLSGDSSPSTAYVFTTLAAESATDVAALSTQSVALVTISGAPKIVGSGTVKVFDPRVIANAISQATADYYWKDIQENNGKSVLPGA